MALPNTQRAPTTSKLKSDLNWNFEAYLDSSGKVLLSLIYHTPIYSYLIKSDYTSIFCH